MLLPAFVGGALVSEQIEPPSRYVTLQSVATTTDESGQHYFIGKLEVSKEAYDQACLLKQRDARAAVLGALTGGAAIVGGIVLFLLVFRVLDWLFRTMPYLLPPTAEEQIATITREYPVEVAMWGGAEVLRVPMLLDQLIDG
jgi:hypothetical protein